MEKIDKFLKIPEELLKKNKQLINAFKQKISITKSNHKTVIINTLDNFRKEGLVILISKTKILTLNTNQINDTIISINTY